MVSDPSSLLDSGSSYIDTFRTHEEVEDIKISVDKARKTYGSDFGRIQKRKKGEIRSAALLFLRFEHLHR